MDEYFDGNAERVEKALLAANEKILQLEQALAEKDRGIANLRTCQCEECDEFLEGEAYCQACWMRARKQYQQLMEQATRFAESVVAYDPYHDGKLKSEARAFLKEREGT